MLLRPVEEFYLRQDEPVRSCLQFLRAHILQKDKNIIEAWSYGMPFFYLNGKRFCWLWVHKKLGWPYIGITEGRKISHPALISEKRAKMKILLIDPTGDIPLRAIEDVLHDAMVICKETRKT